MKIGILSDIHSNIDALQAAFNKFDEEKVDKYIILGDILGIGPYPDKCYDLVLLRKDKILGCIRGNHEGYFLNGIPKFVHNGTILMSDDETASHKWNHSKIKAEQIEFIKSMPVKQKLEVDGVKILLEHYPMDDNNKFKEFHMQPNVEEINELVEDKDIDIFLFGHTHYKDYIENSDGKLFINPGSVGCPKNTDSACCGILNIENGKCSYEQLDVKYDIEKVVNEILEINYSKCRFNIKCFFGEKYLT